MHLQCSNPQDELVYPWGDGTSHILISTKTWFSSWEGDTLKVPLSVTSASAEELWVCFQTDQPWACRGPISLNGTASEQDWHHCAPLPFFYTEFIISLTPF